MFSPSNCDSREIDTKCKTQWLHHDMLSSGLVVDAMRREHESLRGIFLRQTKHILD